ncbi:selenocysteine-specific translation elongation factor [Thermincola ferriacetica]|uniref:Selenocysteine-specific elongation factor n=2 Tax=Thermincola ferriacetica TaxID=281456 RepID=A0A0L6W5L5_9FIRM|nr:selenocysteine-specific translation elongation factor [Thermincola ferriacetica]
MDPSKGMSGKMGKHFIIGTAGHVDHGKTMLVKAMTGKDTDRLKEEKERGISIELGFAPIRLPSGIQAGIVDVPGHERFIKNMLAGVGGMDLVLLVIAADEGVMPQTTEHLDIIKLLQVPQGIIVISKIDLVDADWLDLVEEEIKEAVKGTVFDGAPVFRVSSTTGEGIRELLDYIDQMAAKMKVRPSTGWPRLAIDRVFTIAGFGTVVTGTLIEGKVKVGDPLEILPKGLGTRVRNIQVHGEKVNEAYAGQRVALNLANVEVEEVRRGDVLTWPGRLKPSHRIDVKLQLLENARQLSHRARVRVHIGTSEILARIILLDRDELNPGEVAYAQVECEEPIVAAKGDRFVIRSYSPMHTIGGGTVIDANPAKHKRFRPDVIEALATKEKGTPEELVIQALGTAGAELLAHEALAKAAGIPETELTPALESLKKAGKIRVISVEGKQFYISDDKFQQWARDITGVLEEYHRKFPLRPGMPKEEIRSRFFPGINNKLYNAILQVFEEEQKFTLTGDSLALFGYVPRVDPEQAKELAAVAEQFLQGEFQPPAWKDMVFTGKDMDPEEVLNYFVNQNILVKLEDNVILHRDVFEKGKQKIIDYLKEKGEITLAEARDLLNSSRKYILPFLNRLDKEKVTRRVEDKRILYK